MDELLARALNTAQIKGARYADARGVSTQEQGLAVKNGVVDGLTRSESAGIGVRVLVGQAWGFASSRELTGAEVDRVTGLAARIAQASALAPGKPVDLGPPVTSCGRYATPVVIDPVAVSIEDKLGLLLQAEAAMARVPGARLRHGSLSFVRERKQFANREGADLEQTLLALDKLGAFQFGSPVVNLTADAVRPAGLGTYGWDDEGLPAVSTPLVSAGRFVGYLISRETASVLGLASNSSMRASGWNRLPLVRLANVSLEPGEWSLEGLIADTARGLFLETNRSWLIDDRRDNFQFGTELGYAIKGGQLGRLLRNCTYTGATPQFWSSCDAVCNARHWTLWGTPNRGQGQPSQVIHTGHGAAPARLRNVRVGIV